MPGASPPDPHIERVAFGKKHLRVFGDGFSTTSQIEVNGVTLPIAPAFSYADRSLEVHGAKKALGLKKRGKNLVVVVERGVRSAEFVY